MNNPEFELLVYLITSAKALPEEPACYGSNQTDRGCIQTFARLSVKNIRKMMLTVHCLVVLTQTKEGIDRTGRFRQNVGKSI